MREIKLLTILVLISALGQISSDLYLSSIPAIGHYFHASMKAAKLTISMYMLGFAFSPLLYGPISDAIGRRKPLLVGLILGSIGCTLCFSAWEIHILIIGRLLQGIGVGAGLCLFRAMLRDIFHGDKLAKYGSYASLISVGAIALGPVLGSFIQHGFGWRYNFLFLLIYTLWALLAVIFFVPETNRHLKPENLQLPIIYKNFATLIKSPIFMGYAALSFLTYSALLAWLTSGSIVLQKVVGLTPIQYGWCYALTGITFALAAFFNGHYVSKIGFQKMLRIGLFNMLLAGLSMLLFWLMGYVNVLVIVGPTMLLLFAVQLIFSNSFAGAFQPFPHIAGIAGALFGFMGIFGGAVSSNILAMSHDESQLPMALTILVSASIALCIYFFVIRNKK